MLPAKLPAFLGSKSKQKLIRLSKKRKKRKRVLTDKQYNHHHHHHHQHCRHLLLAFSSVPLYSPTTQSTAITTLRMKQGDFLVQGFSTLFLFIDQWPRQSVNIVGFGGNHGNSSNNNSCSSSPFIKCSQVILSRDLIGEKK